MSRLVSKQSYALIKLYFSRLNYAPLRQRVTLLVVGLLLLFGISYLAVGMHVFSSLTNISKEIEVTQIKLKNLHGQVQLIAKSMETQTGSKAEQQLHALTQQTTALATQLAGYEGHIANTSTLILALKSTIRRQRNLSLVHLKTQSPTPIFQSPQESLFENHVDVELKATYSATAQLVKAIEQMKRPIEIESLRYRANQYPYAMISMQLQMLSYSKHGGQS